MFVKRKSEVSFRTREIGSVFGVLLLLMVLLFLTPERVGATETEYKTPYGYYENDYQNLVAFLEIPNGTLKNGHWVDIEKGYKPGDPTTWTGVTWAEFPGMGKRVTSIKWSRTTQDLVGELDLSECLELKELYCNSNNLTSLNVYNCVKLETLICYGNGLTNLDVSGCRYLERLECHSNPLENLDLSDCIHLKSL